MIRKTLPLLFAAATGLMATSTAQAASDEECANWLCLPAGYPGDSNCEGPYDAMIDRLKDGKSPLPDYSSCAAEDTKPEYQMFARHGKATRYDGEYHKNETCRMRKSEWEPTGCNGRNYWYVEMYDNQGTQIGETHYIRR